jgi:hypothetical protein
MDQTSRAVSHHAQKLRSDCAVVIAIQTIIFTSFLLYKSIRDTFPDSALLSEIFEL